MDRAHTWTAAAAETPIRITAATSQSVPLLRVENGETYDWLHVDEAGLVGLSDDPDAMLCVRARSLTAADIRATLAPWAWYDAQDWDADDIDEDEAENTEIPTWFDKAHPELNGTTLDRSLYNDLGTNKAMRVYKTQRISTEQCRCPRAVPAVARPAYMSQFVNPTNTLDYFYNRLKGSAKAYSSSFADWTVVVVAACQIGAQRNATLGGPNGDGVGGWTTPGVLIASGDGAAYGTYGGALFIARYPTAYDGTWEQFSNDDGPHSTSPDRSYFRRHIFQHHAGDQGVSCTVDGVEQDFKVAGAGSVKSYPFWYQWLGVSGWLGASYGLSQLYYAEVIVFDYKLSAGQLATLNAYLDKRYAGGAGVAPKDLLRLKDQPGTTRLVYDKQYRLGLNVGTAPGANIDLIPNSASEIGLRITAATSQTANLQEWGVAAKHDRTYVDKDGYLYAWDGTVGLKVVPWATPGTEKLVLHGGPAGGAAGVPTWRAVIEEDFGFTDLPTANVSISAHGLCPKAPNDTAKFLRGDATWAAAGGGSLTVEEIDGSPSDAATTKIKFPNDWLAAAAGVVTVLGSTPGWTILGRSVSGSGSAGYFSGASYGDIPVIEETADLAFGPLKNHTNSQGGDTTLTAPGMWYTITSIDLEPGIWLVTAHAVISSSAANTALPKARIRVDTGGMLGSYPSQEGCCPAMGSGNYGYVPLSVQFVVTVTDAAATTTFNLQGRGTAGSLAKGALDTGEYPANELTAVRIGGYVAP